MKTDNRFSHTAASRKKKTAFLQVQLITAMFAVSTGLMVGTAEVYNAIKSGDAAQFRKLLQENTPEIIKMSSPKASTPLHWAAIENAMEAARMLVEKNINVNAMDHNGYTPLHWAAIGDSAEVAAVLVNNGARVETRSEDGVTPLHLAMQENSLGAARVLLENGASIYTETEKGSTPLSFVKSTEARTLLEEYVSEPQKNNEQPREENRSKPQGTTLAQRIEYDSGAVYTGTVLKGKKHGKGTLVYPNREQYVGTWVDGKKHGFGVYSFPDGEEYTGEWKKGQRHGPGTYTWPNGDTIKGRWENGEFKAGSGTYHFPDGDIYKGQWRNNMMWGYGIYITAEGREFAGYWEENRFVKTSEKPDPKQTGSET
ncbi:MAG: ankyrin repeat domain-containing protein [Verrucomicrobiota bacterium]